MHAIWSSNVLLFGGSLTQISCFFGGEGWQHLFCDQNNSVGFFTFLEVGILKRHDSFDNRPLNPANRDSVGVAQMQIGDS